MSARRIVKTHTYMDPVEYDDGHGFRTIVEMSDGTCALISEIHRSTTHRELNETMVFKCSREGSVTDWSEIYGNNGGTTAHAITDVSSWMQ